MTDKYLPIGTIVLLKNGKKRLMIDGFCVQSEETGELYDYSGCFYPEGIISASNTFTFNHDQIERIYFIGYNDEEEQLFKKKLPELLSKSINNSQFNQLNIDGQINQNNGIEELSFDNLVPQETNSGESSEKVVGQNSINSSNDTINNL